MMMMGRKLKRIGVRKLFQLWETVSEGSPITPQFTYLNDLINYQLANDTSITKNMSKEDWEEFFKHECGLIDIRTSKFTTGRSEQ